MEFIDYIHLGTQACGEAKITYADTVTTTCMSESDLSLGSCTDNEEADVAEIERLSFSETGSIPAPYTFEPSGTESESSSENSSDGSDHSKLSKFSL